MSVRLRRRRRFGVLLVIAAGLLATLFGPATPASAQTGDGTWRISNYQSGKVANVAGGSTANGAQVIQWTYVESQWNSQWFRVHVGSGRYRYENRWSRQCLDANLGNLFSGAPVVQWPCDSSRPSQRWLEFQHPTLPVVHMRTDAGLFYLTVENGSFADGARLVLMPYNQSLTSQTWQRWE